MPSSRNRVATLLIAFLAVAGVAVTGAFLYMQHALGSNLERELSERLGTESRVGIAYLGLLPVGLYLSSVAVRNPEGFNDRYFLSVDSLNLKLGQYTRKEKRVTSPQMDINGLKVWVEYQGKRSNADVIKRNLAAFDRRRGGSRADKTKFIIDELRIRDVRTQLRSGSDETSTELPNIVLRDVGKGRGGVTAGELADIVTQAVLREALRQEFRRELDQHIEEERRELREKFDRKLEGLFD